MLTTLRLLGISTALLYAGSLSNYIAKPILRRLKGKSPFTSTLKAGFRILVRNHKVLGVSALAVAWVHFFTALGLSYLLPSGYAALFLLTLTAILGMAGAFYFKTSFKMWKSVHRALAFLLLIVILTHIVFKW